MKVLCILALAVAVSAEADHHLLYESLLPATTYVQKPLVYNTPVVNTYAAKPLVYSAPVVHPVVTPVKTYANDAVKPFNYAAKGQYTANSAGVVHVAKREAEADPQLLYKSIVP